MHRRVQYVEFEAPNGRLIRQLSRVCIEPGWVRVRWSRMSLLPSFARIRGRRSFDFAATDTACELGLHQSRIGFTMAHVDCVSQRDRARLLGDRATVDSMHRDLVLAGFRSAGWPPE